MSEEFDKVIEILEKSVAKHGDKPLTTRHLLNILRMAERQFESEDRVESSYEMPASVSDLD